MALDRLKKDNRAEILFIIENFIKDKKDTRRRHIPACQVYTLEITNQLL